MRAVEPLAHVEHAGQVDRPLADLDAESRKLAVEIASIPEDIRGFGHVKMRNLKEAKQREARLLWSLRNPQAPAKAA